MNLNFKKSIKHMLLYLYHKHKNRHLVRFPYSAQFSHRCTFEGRNFIGKGAWFYGTLGYGTYVGDYSFLSADIGRFCSIGSRCRFINATHPYKSPFVTTSPLFFSTDKSTFAGSNSFAKEKKFDEFLYYDKEREIVNRIGSDVWIGLDVNLIGGVCIGDGAVILSKAVVTKDVPPYAIVGGIPAKIVGYRYDEETIKFLLETKWWDNSPDWFEEQWELLSDIEKLKKYYKTECQK